MEGADLLYAADRAGEAVMAVDEVVMAVDEEGADVVHLDDVYASPDLTRSCQLLYRQLVLINQ